VFRDAVFIVQRDRTLNLFGNDGIHGHRSGPRLMMLIVCCPAKSGRHLGHQLLGLARTGDADRSAVALVCPSI
jgi:hypothetical protein